MQVLPERQQLKLGDTVAIWRNLDFPVVTLEPNQYFEFASQNRRDSMVLGLHPTDSTQTRLVWRIHLGPYDWAAPWVFAQIFKDFADFLVVRQNLLGITARAEGRSPDTPEYVYVELPLWLACFIAFLAAELTLLFKEAFIRPLLAAAATGLLTAWLVLVQPLLWITALGTLTSLALLWWALQVEWRPTGDGLEAQAGYAD